MLKIKGILFENTGHDIRALICLLGLFVLTLLNGCTTTKKDGPPSYNVDVSNIPDATPKVEKVSKTGNKPYEVFGKRYYVMNSSKNYKERGVASWYGTKFHKRNTSSGERYDMLAMTAAHKSLPLPTYVEVKNLSNGKKVIVKVNDRGPFEGNRLIDLSYAAAKKLGILGHGTAKVEISAIDPFHYDKTPSSNKIYLTKNTKSQSHNILAKERSRSPVYLQVGAFRNKLYAEKLQKQLMSLVGSPVRVTQLAKAKKLYRVQIGPIKDATTVARINKQLKSIGLDGKELLV